MPIIQNHSQVFRWLWLSCLLYVSPVTMVESASGGTGEGLVPIQSSKPEAPIEISYRLIGTAIPGQPVQVEVTFQSPAPGIRIASSYTAYDGLSVVSTNPLQRISDVAKPSKFQQLLTLTGVVEGIHYLTVFASMDLDGFKQARVIAIPIQVGKSARVIRKIAPGMGELLPDGEGGVVRSMKAGQVPEREAN